MVKRFSYPRTAVVRWRARSIVAMEAANHGLRCFTWNLTAKLNAMRHRDVQWTRAVTTRLKTFTNDNRSRYGATRTGDRSVATATIHRTSDICSVATGVSLHVGDLLTFSPLTVNCEFPASESDDLSSSKFRR